MESMDYVFMGFPQEQHITDTDLCCAVNRMSDMNLMSQAVTSDWVLISWSQLKNITDHEELIVRSQKHYLK